MPFSSVAQFFPLILAPGVVALARRQRRLAWIDGPLLVWSCVVGAAVLWTLVLAAAMGEDITRAVIGRGVLLGLTSALADTWATRKGKAQEEAAPVPETPSAEPTVEAAPVDLTPRNDVPRREMDLDFGSSPQ